MKKILWIEDESDIIKYAVSPLKRKGYVFEIVESYEGFSKIKPNLKKFDLILLDLILPEKNSSPPFYDIGFKILDELSLDQNKSIPVIVFTVINNYITNSKLQDFKNIINVLYKPIPSYQLLNEVEITLENKNLNSWK